MGVELLGGVDQGYPGLSALDAEIGVVGCGRWVGEQVVDLAGDVAFQTSDDFSTGLAFFWACAFLWDGSLYGQFWFMLIGALGWRSFGGL